MPEKLTIIARDYNGRTWYLQDATGLKISTTENGYYLASWQLNREFGVAWSDIGLNFQITIYGPRGFDIAWEGRLETIEPSFQDGKSNLICSATGYWASVFDLFFNGLLSASATPEAMLSSLISGGYVPQLSSSTAQLLVTGVTADTYRTPNSGTDDVIVGKVILDICASGNSTSQKVVPAVWDNRVLSTMTVVTFNPTADYTLRRNHIVSTGLRRSLSSVADRVTLRYMLTGALARFTSNDTTVQANLGISYASGFASYIRTRLLDFTGLGDITAPAAQRRAEAVLSDTKRVKTDSRAVVVRAGKCILDNALLQELPLWAIRAGKWLSIPDLFPRPNLGGTGTVSGDASITTMFYIKQTEYEHDSGTLTITPETSSRVEDIISS
jgi:hypothetical protein